MNTHVFLQVAEVVESVVTNTAGVAARVDVYFPDVSPAALTLDVD